MNRTNDVEFFRYWDLCREIKKSREFLRPKLLMEIQELEDAILEEAGFDCSHSYQEAIRLYQDRDI